MEIIVRPVGPLQANCYIVYDSATGAGIAIDPGGDPELVLASFNEAGARCSAIFITHGHPDHIGGVAGLAELTGAEVCASREAAMVLADPEKFQLFPGLPGVPPHKVDRVLVGGEIVPIEGIEVKVIATRGHSQGSLTFLVDDCLFTGDLLFHGSIGRTDLPGGSFDELAAAVKNLILRYPPETRVYPGHGNSTTLEAEREDNPFLTDLGW